MLDFIVEAKNKPCAKGEEEVWFCYCVKVYSTLKILPT